MPEQEHVTVFYRLPVEHVEAGMSTADGQDVTKVALYKDHVLISVYTPSSDEAEDTENRSDDVTGSYVRGSLIELATFSNTEIDGSSHEFAVEPA